MKNIEKKYVKPGFCIIDKKWRPIMVLSANLNDSNKHIYGLPFDYEVGKNKITKINSFTFVMSNENPEKNILSNNEIELELIDLKDSIILHYDKKFTFWKIAFSLSYFIDKLLGRVKYKEKNLCGQPLPYRARYIIEAYAYLRKHQHLTEINENYISDKKDIGKFLKLYNITDSSSITSDDMFQYFGNKYYKEQVVRYIEAIKYLKSNK